MTAKLIGRILALPFVVAMIIVGAIIDIIEFIIKRIILLKD